MQKRLRYADLLALGIVKNRQTIHNWQEKYGFPLGQLTGPNCRTWTEGEIQDYLDTRPTAPKQTPGRVPPARRRGRRKKSKAKSFEATA
jgi:hypothetical protein